MLTELSKLFLSFPRDWPDIPKKNYPGRPLKGSPLGGLKSPLSFAAHTLRSGKDIQAWRAGKLTKIGVAGQIEGRDRDRRK